MCTYVKGGCGSKVVKISRQAIHDFKDMKIKQLQMQYENSKQQLAELKLHLHQCKNTKEQEYLSERINQVRRRQQTIKKQLLNYGTKIEHRGRPSLPVENRASYNQIKLTLRLKQENVEYLRSLKKDGLIKSYNQWFDCFIDFFRQQKM